MTKKQIARTCGTIMMVMGVTMANMSVVMAAPTSDNREGVEAVTEQLSSNANLQGIYSIDLNKPFDKDTLAYTADVARDVKSLNITVQTEDESATTAIEGHQRLNLGENIITIWSFAGDGTQKRYVITVNRGSVSSNATITERNGIESVLSYTNDTVIPTIAGSLVLDQEIQPNVFKYTGRWKADQSGTETFYVNIGPYSRLRVSGITASRNSLSTKRMFMEDIGSYVVNVSNMEHGANILYLKVISPDNNRDTYTITVAK